MTSLEGTVRKQPNCGRRYGFIVYCHVVALLENVSTTATVDKTDIVNNVHVRNVTFIWLEHKLWNVKHPNHLDWSLPENKALLLCEYHTTSWNAGILVMIYCLLSLLSPLFVIKKNTAPSLSFTPSGSTVLHAITFNTQITPFTTLRSPS